MLNFSLFSTYNITPNDEIILLGIKMNYFSSDAAKDYIYWKIENDMPVCEKDISIFDCCETERIIEALTDGGTIPDDNSVRILRYMALRELSTTGESLLHEIESIYADFDYPEDMESFIYYMPFQSMDDDIADSDPVKVLIDRFNKFMRSEYDYINSLYC